jgi:hypothetical protein
MSLHPNKLDDELLVTEPAVKRCVRVVYEKVMVKSWTMSVHTEPAHLIVSRHVWLVATRTGYVNPNVLNDLMHHILK